MSFRTALRPLLFLDVDGPLIPFGAAPEHGYPIYQTGNTSANPLLDRINPAHGVRLAALPCDLVWATTWMDEANECVSPLLGLPPLPVVSWPDATEGEERDGTHWKTRALVAWAAGRPFAWVDDEITGLDRAWVSAHHGGPALLHRVDSGRGLADADFVTIDAWLRAPR